MKPVLIPKMQSQFDGLAQQHPDEPKVEFWFARYLQEPHSYVRFSAIQTAVNDGELEIDFGII